jgi:lipopolysaccharide export system protein LptA
MSLQHLIDKFSRVSASLIILLLLSVNGFSAEQKKTGQEKKIKGPITITSKTMTTDNKAHTALFENSVVARTTGMTIYSDRMLVYYEEGTGNVTRIDAAGNVKVIKENKVITSNEATYYAGVEKVIFTGEPRAVEGENVVTGKIMTYLMDDDRFLVEDSKVILTKKKEQ